MRLHVKVSLLFLLLVTLASALSPPSKPPDELVSAYTLNDTVPLEFFYVDDTLQGELTHYKFPAASIAATIKGVNKTVNHLQAMLARGLTVDQLAASIPKEQLLYLTLIGHAKLQSSHLFYSHSIRKVSKSYEGCQHRCDRFCVPLGGVSGCAARCTRGGNL